MSTATTLLRTRATTVWFALIAATLVSWALGTDHGLGDHRAASTVILLVAFTKIRFVGLYFMELRDAPIALRIIFEGYCIVVFAAVLGTYLAT
jgi:predicted signal transduction protein with EAL and GGDEF domain